MDDLLHKLEQSFTRLLAQSYAEAYLRTMHRKGEPLAQFYNGLVLRNIGRASSLELKYFQDLKARARMTLERANQGEFSKEEAVDRIFKETQRIGKTASSRMRTFGTIMAMGDGLVYVPSGRGFNPHVCPPDDVCHMLIAGRVFKASTMRINAYANFGAPKSAWVPCVPMHPHCSHYIVPAYKSQLAKLAARGIEPEDIPEEGIYIG